MDEELPIELNLATRLAAVEQLAIALTVVIASSGEAARDNMLAALGAMQQQAAAFDDASAAAMRALIERLGTFLTAGDGTKPDPLRYFIMLGLAATGAAGQGGLPALAEWLKIATPEEAQADLGDLVHRETARLARQLGKPVQSPRSRQPRTQKSPKPARKRKER